MSLAAIPRLLPPPQMARGMPDAYSCEVRRLLLAQNMLRGDRSLVILFGRVHTAAEIRKGRSAPSGLRRAYCCVARLFRR